MNEGFKNLRKGNQLNRLLAEALKSPTNELTNQYGLKSKLAQSTTKQNPAGLPERLF
jgi:hypothetical protein